MNLSRRGGGVLAATLATGLSAGLFQDGFVYLVALVLAALIVFEAIWIATVTKNPRRWYSLSIVGESARGKRPLHPGDSARDSYLFTKRVGGEARLRSQLPFLTLSQGAPDSGGRHFEILADFKSPYAGEFRSKTVELEATGPLGLFGSTFSLPAEFAYSVYPRTLEVAITSARLLSLGGIGDTPIERVGIGTEFYDIRGYQPGDDFRQINWKATARRGELMTSEHMREVGGACYLVLEAVAPDYFDRDRLAAAFLGIANNLTMQGTAFGVLVHDGQTIKEVKRIDAPTASLAFALTVALEFADVDLKGIQHELSVKSSHSLKQVDKILTESGSSALSRVLRFAVSEKTTVLENQDSAQSILELIRESANDPPAILYVSGIFGSVESIIELGTSAKRVYGANFVVANPAEPWVAAPGEQSAYDTYIGQSRTMKALRNAAIDYQFGEPTSVVQKVISA